MRRLALPFFLSLGLLVASMALAGGPPGGPPRPATAKRVWSSEEVEALRNRGLISVVGQEAPAEESAAEQAALEEMPARPAPRPIRAKDPEWYREQAEKLRTAMEVNHAEIRFLLRELRDARYWEGGVNLSKENLGITPESALQVLEVKNRGALDEIDALENLARRNDILPGAIR